MCGTEVAGHNPVKVSHFLWQKRGSCWEEKCWLSSWHVADPVLQTAAQKPLALKKA